MNLEHVALTVTDPTDIENFYHNVLGMSEIKNFTLDESLAREIFDIEQETEVFHLQREALLLEIFLTSGQYTFGFNHICIYISNREEIAGKAEKNGYPYLRLKRGNSEMIFIRDKSGNVFELKQI